MRIRERDGPNQALKFGIIFGHIGENSAIVSQIHLWSQNGEQNAPLGTVGKSALGTALAYSLQDGWRQLAHVSFLAVRVDWVHGRFDIVFDRDSVAPALQAP